MRNFRTLVLLLLLLSCPGALLAQAPAAERVRLPRYLTAMRLHAMLGPGTAAGPARPGPARAGVGAPSVSGGLRWVVRAGPLVLQAGLARSRASVRPFIGLSVFPPVVRRPFPPVP